MKGESKIIEALNRALTIELTAINQYFVQAKMCGNWGYKKLAAKHREESIEEMRHAGCPDRPDHFSGRGAQYRPL